MARKEEIEISIDDSGEVQLHVNGVPGSDCMKLTAEIEKALGIVINREKTSEYYKEVDIIDTHISTGTAEEKR